MLSDRLRIFLYRWFFTNLAGLTLGDWLLLLANNQFRISPRFWPRATFVTLCSVGNSLQRLMENGFYARKLEAVHVPPPLFILGHWRSGTTHLHKLLSLDDRFVTPTMVEVLFPHSILSGGPMGMFMNWFLPSHRIVDQVKLGVNEPFEDEFALALMTRLSPYFGWTFPRREDFYDTHLTLNDSCESARWKSAFRLLARKLAKKHGKPAIFKSPPHLGRVRHLIELFPDARFIHIHRDPLEIFSSTCRLIEKGVDGLKLQNVPWNKTTDHVLSRYREMYAQFFEDQHLIPSGHLVEVKYSDLVTHPLDVMRRIYEDVSLGGFDAFHQRLAQHLDAEKTYSRNVHEDLPPDVKGRIKSEWSEIARRLGYDIDG